ncbi:MAG: hypothetical protein U5L10_02065 [Candidatus Moranbacteria bacterium]|nr:hypothetical protein [Candidatus Moranbacteria bacterium]
MEKSVKKAQELIERKLNDNYKFALWLLIVLTFDYMGLFVLETILPGFVMNFFNLNLLLFVVLAGWLFLAFFTEDQKKAEIGSKVSAFLLTAFLALLALGLLFSLYKAAALEFTVYFVLAAIAGKLLFDHWAENNK